MLYSTIFDACRFFMLTVKNLLFFHAHREPSVLVNALTEKSNFVFFERIHSIILIPGSVGFDFGKIIGHEDFYTT